MRPPGRPATLLEVALPEEAPSEPAQLKCFCPPPDSRSEQAEFGATKAWAVEVPPEECAALVELAADFRVVPFVDARPKGMGSPVEVVISEGQAEARMSWWMSAPAGWGPLDRLVGRVVEISQRGGTALPVHLEEPDEDDEPTPGSGTEKKGLFGKLLGG